MEAFTGRPTEIRDFIEFIVAGAHPTLYYCIVGLLKRKDVDPSAKDNPKPMQWKHFSVLDVDGGIEYVKQLMEARVDAYIQCTLLKVKPPPGSKGTKEHTAGGSILWLDVDVYKTGKSRDEVLKSITSYVTPPTLIVDSGGGFHVYWRLDNFVSNAIDLESRNKSLANEFDADACGSFEHILRIPGTYNFKNETPRETRLTLVRPDRIYSLSAFPVAGSTQEESEIDAFEVYEEECPQEEIDKLPTALKTLLIFGPDKSTDRSTHDWKVICALIEEGLSPGQVLTLVMNPDHETSRKAQAKDGLRYAIHTIKKAAIEAKRKYRVKPKAPLQTIINGLIERDPQTGREELRLPQQSYSVARDSCNLLMAQGYRFVYDDTDNIPYILTPEGEIIRAIMGDVRYNSWISRLTLFTQENRAFKMFQTGIMAYIQETGERATINPWIHFNVDRAQLDVLVDHETYREFAVVRAGSAKVCIERNGFESKLMFPSVNTRGTQLKLEDNLKTIDHGECLRSLLDLTYHYFAVRPEAKEFLTAYMLAAPIAHGYIRTGMLPLLHLSGRPGHGKTEIIKTLCAFVHGSNEPESGTTVASAREIAKSDIMMPFDDYEHLPQDLREFILTSATGAKRHKFAGDKEGIATQRNHILIAITSVGDLPLETLKRRSLRVEVSHARYPTADYNSFYRDRLIRQRSLMWNAYLRFLVEDVFPELSVGTFYERVEQIAKKITVPAFRPMAEFMALTWFIAEKLGKYDPRFLRFATGENLHERWLHYFGLCDESTLEAYDEFIPGLRCVADTFVGELSSGRNVSTLTAEISATGAALCTGSVALCGLQVELPQGAEAGVPYDPARTLVLSGRSTQWFQAMARSGFRHLFQGTHQTMYFEKQIKYQADVVGTSLRDINYKEMDSRWYSDIYRLGHKPMWVQFVRIGRGGGDLIIRVFFEYLPGEYKPPRSGLKFVRTRTDTMSIIETLKYKAQTGQLTREEAIEAKRLIAELKKGEIDGNA